MPHQVIVSELVMILPPRVLSGSFWNSHPKVTSTVAVTISLVAIRRLVINGNAVVCRLIALYIAQHIPVLLSTISLSVGRWNAG